MRWKHNKTVLRTLTGCFFLVWLYVMSGHVFADEGGSLEQQIFFDEQASVQEPVVGLEGEASSGETTSEEARVYSGVSESANLWRFTTSVSSSVAAQSNFSKSAHDPRGELIYSVGPVFKLARVKSAIRFDFVYSPAYRRYKNNPSYDNLDHALSGVYRYRSGKTYISGGERLSFTSNRSTGEQGSGQKTFTNTFFNEWGWDLSPKISTALIFSNTNVDYQTSSLKANSNSTSSFGPRLYYHIRPKISLFVQRLYSSTDYYNGGGNNSKSTITSAGLRGQLRKGTVANIQAGMTERSADAAGSNSSSFSLNGSLGQELSRKTTVAFSASRSLEESILAGGGYFESLSLSSTLNYKYSPRTSGSLALGWTHDQYPNESTETDPVTGVTTRAKRESDTYSVTLSTDYYWSRSMRLSGSVSSVEKRSNFTSTEYKDNMATMSINYAF
jgi:hypothetical protein